MTKDDAIKALKDHKICFEHDFGWNRTVLDALDTAIEALAADAVEIVRCGECAYCEWKNEVCTYGWCKRISTFKMRDEYCSDGERRESDRE